MEDWAVGHVCTDAEEWTIESGLSLAEFRIGVVSALVEDYPCLDIPEATICIYTEKSMAGYAVYAEGYCFNAKCIESVVLGLVD